MSALPIFSSRDFFFRAATKRDDAEIRSLLRENPMDSWIQASVEREPSYFEKCTPKRASVTVVARRSSTPQELIGMYRCDFFPVHLDGGAGEAAYLGGLRVAPEYRHRIRLLREGFRSIPALVPGVKRVPLIFTSLAEENTRARRLLEKGLQEMPIYRKIADMETFAVGTGQGRPAGLLEKAGVGDAPAVAEFYNRTMASVRLSPVLDVRWLTSSPQNGNAPIENFWLHRSGGNIAACIAVWDQRAFKQIVIRGYKQPLLFLRPFYNIAAALTGAQKLPPVGGRLEQVFLSFAAFAKTAEDKALAVVREALFRAGEAGASIALMGIVPGHLCYGTLRKSLRPRIYRTCIETVELPGLAVPDIGKNLVQPEVALL